MGVVVCLLVFQQIKKFIRNHRSEHIVKTAAFSQKIKTFKLYGRSVGGGVKFS